MSEKDYSKISDTELVSTILNGDQKAFEYLIKKNQKRIATVIIGILGKCQEAEDVGQETFIRFYYSLKEFRNESAILTFLTRIAINLSLNELKKRKRNFFISLFKDEAQTEEIELSDDYSFDEKEEKNELIQKALQYLDSGIRTVIILRLIEGYSVKETAEILEIPQGTVLSRQSRGQEKLKLILTKYI